jgi:hypothetical protein
MSKWIGSNQKKSGKKAGPARRKKLSAIKEQERNTIVFPRLSAQGNYRK